MENGKQPIGILALNIQRKYNIPMSNGQFNRVIAAIQNGEHDRISNLTYEEFSKEFGPIEDQ